MPGSTYARMRWIGTCGSTCRPFPDVCQLNACRFHEYSEFHGLKNCTFIEFSPNNFYFIKISPEKFRVLHLGRNLKFRSRSHSTENINTNHIMNSPIWDEFHPIEGQLESLRGLSVFLLQSRNWNQNSAGLLRGIRSAHRREGRLWFVEQVPSAQAHASLTRDSLKPMGRNLKRPNHVLSHQAALKILPDQSLS